MTSASAAPSADSLPAPRPIKHVRGRAGWIVAVVFAFLYALAAFQGLSNFIGLTQSFSTVGVVMPGNALIALIGLIAAPILVFALVLWGTRRARTVSAVLVYLVGFAVVAVITLDLQSLYRSIVPFIIPV
ncbi:hypothetical protein [Subtercola boreus]|uniref:Uncharacterized protein n=1 Tax=Subtercola boreus TaxID=120213 RepID=A0A3E0WD34_9MICO|nr:hypothetical protein [Subtercola boreus]RFA22704.1 hypothetical protein B7R24_03590 [Subtercola boreus]RFA23059.1 hypothetical protein B7R23_03585 [Subtercola boreus]RFA28812.1 hypothetical protein B7R25_03600 [Subtercola boreus]